MNSRYANPPLSTFLLFVLSLFPLFPSTFANRYLRMKQENVAKGQKTVGTLDGVMRLRSCPQGPLSDCILFNVVFLCEMKNLNILWTQCHCCTRFGDPIWKITVWVVKWDARVGGSQWNDLFCCTDWKYSLCMKCLSVTSLRWIVLPHLVFSSCSVNETLVLNENYA